LITFSGKFQMQEQIPGDDERKQQRPDCHRVLLESVSSGWSI
jgi:hypothetical protein